MWSLNALWSVVVIFLASYPGTCVADFVPGCSFVGGQCQYSVQLGHAGQCDSAAGTGSGTRSGDTTTSTTTCCNDLKVNMGTIRSDISLLQTQVNGLLSNLSEAQGDLADAQTKVNQTEAARDALLVSLRQKEAELNSSQAEVANLIHRTGEEITALRAELANMTAQADNCRAAIGLPPVDLHTSASLRGPISQQYCNFSTISSPPCKFQITQSAQLYLMDHAHTSSAGPATDHSIGTAGGRYLGLDAGRVASLSASATSRQFSATSDEFEPANSYCFFFYYSMVGQDVDTLEITVKIGSGTGYPVWTASGQQSQDWVLGQLELDSEYTANPFSLVFLAKSKAYHRYTTNYYYNADIGIDDLYAFNTTCDNIPKCPVTSVHQNTANNVTSCYTFHARALTWQDAYHACREEGPWSALVSVESDEEQRYLAAAIAGDPALTAAGQYGFFTSGNDIRYEHRFDWSDTGKERPVKDLYENWHRGQPNNVGGVQDCLLLQYAADDYEWGDVDCKSAHPFICEVSYPV